VVPGRGRGMSRQGGELINSSPGLCLLPSHTRFSNLENLVADQVGRGYAPGRFQNNSVLPLIFNFFLSGKVYFASGVGVEGG